MSDKYMTLLGAEQVQSAANAMRSAAAGMQSAASSIDEALSRNQRFLDDWLARFIEAIEQQEQKRVQGHTPRL